MTGRFRSVTLAAAGMCLPLVALAACSSPHSSAHSPDPAAAAHPGFAGYEWTVVAIARGGANTAIPARYSVDLIFAPGGQFIANDPVNTHSGTYEVTGGGFVTSNVAVSLAGYAGHDPIILLAQSAIGSFDTSARAAASVAGNQLTVVVRGYTLTCRRNGAQGNLPRPSPSPSG